MNRLFQIRLLLLYIIAVTFFKVAIDFFVLSTVSYIEIEGNTLESPHLKIYYSNSFIDLFHEDGFIESRSVQTQLRKKKNPGSYIAFMRNQPLSKIRLDVNDSVSNFTLKKISFYSIFGKPTIWNSIEINSYIDQTNNIEVVFAEGNKILFKVLGGDPWIKFNQTVKTKNIFLEYFFPLILAALLLLIISNFEWKKLPAFSDIRDRNTSFSASYKCLDGIRGIAALLVLIEHSMPEFHGAGRMGVLLFFCLSGFLLTTPFIYKPANCLSIKYLKKYFRRRVYRIIPLYFCVVTIIFLFKEKNVVSFIRHLLFLQADAHLWTIPQEMFFYLVLPFILIFISVVLKNKANRVILFFIPIALFFQLYLTPEVLPLYGIQKNIAPMIGVFLLGVAASYFYHGIYINSSYLEEYSNRNSNIISILGILLIFVLLSFSMSKIWISTTPALAKFYQYILSGGLSLLILISLTVRNSLLDKMLSFKGLCAVGVVGYSFYLFHPLMIFATKKFSSIIYGYDYSSLWLTITAGISTYVLSIFTYSYIEKPFLNKSKNH